MRLGFAPWSQPDKKPWCLAAWLPGYAERRVGRMRSSKAVCVKERGAGCFSTLFLAYLEFPCEEFEQCSLTILPTRALHVAVATANGSEQLDIFTSIL